MKVKIKLVTIGNSRIVRIPDKLIEQCGLGDTVELHVEGDHLVIRSRRPRDGWEEGFRAAVESPEKDELVVEGVATNDFDEKEWRW
jgi:antitoxin MazE